jgi:hypothetical protein
MSWTFLISFIIRMYIGFFFAKFAFPIFHVMGLSKKKDVKMKKKSYNPRTLGLWFFLCRAYLRCWTQLDHHHRHHKSLNTLFSVNLVGFFYPERPNFRKKSGARYVFNSFFKICTTYMTFVKLRFGFHLSRPQNGFWAFFYKSVGDLLSGAAFHSLVDL